MLGLNCLIKNTVAVQHIKDAIEILVGERMESSGIATFPEVYNDLRKAGLEVDAESAGALYDGLYGAIDDKGLSTTEEVEEFAGKDFTKQIKSVTDDIKGEAKTPKEEQLSQQSPEKHAVTSISRLFQSKNYENVPRVKTVMRQMQDLVTKAAVSLLPKSDKKGMMLSEALDAFFDVESNQFRTLDGQLNTLKTLHTAVKEQVKNYVDQVAAGLDSDQEALFREQWDQYTEAFINSNYDIVLSKGNQNSLVNEALQQIEVDGVQIVDINGNVKWSALIEHNDPNTIVEKVKDLFRTGFKESDGTITSYNNQQATRIGDYFKRLYLDKLDAAQKRTVENNRTKNQSAKNIISDFIKDRGFFNLVKDKDGNLLLSQADWNNALKYIKAQIDRSDVGKDKQEREIRGMDLVQNKLRTFLNSQVKDDGSPKFTTAQKNLIENEFVKIVMAKLATSTNEPTSLDRLIALSNINQGGAFNNETQQSVNKVVGVSGINQNVLNQIKQLAGLAQSILAGSVVTGSTSNNPDVNRGAYAFTALTEIDRKIKEILRQHKIDNSTQQRVVKYLADIMGGGTVSLLLNPNNVVENIFTQFATNIGESFNLLFTNPKLFFKTFGSFQGDFWTQWANYAQGGASNEITNESDLSSDIQSSERFRARSVINEFKQGPKGVASVIAKSPAYVVSLFSRMIMNSFDAATTTSLMRKRMLQTTYKSLINQGKTPNEVLSLMDKSFNIPDNIKREIDSENTRIRTLLEGAGFPVNNVMMAQNARDMRLSVYEDVLRDHTAVAGGTIKQSTEIAKALVEAAQAQAKMLGGKKQIPARDVLSSLIYGSAEWILKPQKAAFAKTREAEAEGKLGKAARLQAAGSVYQNFFGKFVGGVANFMALGMTATPYGFIIARSLKSERNEYAYNHPGASDILNANPEEIKKYAELNGLMRSVVTRAIMGSTLMAAFIAKVSLGDDDEEDEGFFQNLLKTKTGRRFIQKHLPLGISMSAPYLFKEDNEKGLDKVMLMFESYTGRDFDTYANLKKSLQYAKTEEERNEVWSKFAGNTFTTYNVNQPEQFIKFKDAINSSLNADKIYTVEENEQIAKEIYQNIDGIVDGFLVNGAIDAIRRAADPNQNVNRFKK